MPHTEQSIFERSEIRGVQKLHGEYQFRLDDLTTMITVRIYEAISEDIAIPGRLV